MPFRDIHRMAAGIGAVELPEVEVGGVVVDWTPAGRGNALEAAVDEHGFGVGVVEAVIVGQAGERRTAGRAAAVGRAWQWVRARRWVASKGAGGLWR